MEFSTIDGHYAATWSKETSQISLTMPGGAILYAIGTTVTYDTSGGIKKHDPKQVVEDGKEDKFGPIVNTNGNYVFDVVWQVSFKFTYDNIHSFHFTSSFLSSYLVTCLKKLNTQ